MKLPHRRQFLHLATAVAAPAVSRFAWAQAYPARTVTIIVPVAAGGGTDVTARIIGQYMSRVLGQQFIVENVTGAGGTIGATRAMRGTARHRVSGVTSQTLGHCLAGCSRVVTKPDAAEDAHSVFAGPPWTR